MIVLFHVTGTAMELFKTDVGSWAYAGDGILRIGAVPLLVVVLWLPTTMHARVWRRRLAAGLPVEGLQLVPADDHLRGARDARVPATLAADLRRRERGDRVRGALGWR